MATHTIDKFKYGSDIFVLQDSGALQLTGGSVTGPVNFGDSVTMDEATVGDLVVNGAASFTNNIQVNTINGVNVEFATLMNYKGAKAATSNLPTSGNSQGDVWHVNADGSEWGWDGTQWQELGKAIDLSGYSTTSHTHGNITAGGDITATAPTVANGDQIIINDNSASKITNGPTFDGSTTTKALTPKGTWETFSQFSGSYNDLTNKPTIPTVPSNIVNTITTTAGAHTAITNQTGDVSFNVPTTAAHVGIKFGYTTSGNNRAVQQDSSGNLYVTQKDDNTNYYHTTGSWNALTYTATANGGAEALAFTIPTGTTASTVAAGNHTHSDYVPLTSDSVTIKSNLLRIQNKSGNTSQAGSYPYITSIHIGDGREVTIDEYGDGYLALHGNAGIFLHTGTPIAVYDSSKAYTVGTVVWYNRKYYRCNTAITTPEAWTSSHWTDISASGGTVKVHSDVLPTVTETYNLGSTSLKWNNVYAKALNGIDIPTSPAFTDANVKQTPTSTSAAYEILFSYTADNTERTEGARKTSTLTYNPATKALVTGGTVDGLTLTASSTGFKIAGGTTSKTLTVSETYTLGAACEKAVTDSTGASAIGTGSSLTTERDVYHGLPTINNSHAYTSSTTIYAPTAGGTSGYYLKGAGTTTAPTWQAPADSSSASAISTGTALATERDIYYGLPTINGAHDYTSSTNIYAPTTAGTQGQALISNGSGAPTWGTAGASIQIVRW